MVNEFHMPTARTASNAEIIRRAVTTDKTFEGKSFEFISTK
jgi:hypothetical protein